MAEKKIRKEGYNSFRAVFSDWSLFKSFRWIANSEIFNRPAWTINSKKNDRGFTLIEIIIAIALFSIFIAGAINILDPAAQLQKANDARRKSDLSQIQKALETYYNDFAKYPPSSPSYKIMFPDNTELSWGGQFGSYMVELPKDSKSSQSYIYFSTGQAYYLYASLERKNKDSQVCNPDGNSATDDKCTNSPASASCGSGVVCNFGVSSPNVNP